MATTTELPLDSRPEIIVSPDQHSHRLREAQELLHRMQSVLVESDNPGLDIISEVLQRAEQYTYQLSQQPDLDNETRKVLEDLSALLMTARKMGKNKNIADRLQNIAMESQKAIAVGRKKDVSGLKKEAREDFKDFINNWRPVFYLLLSSPDFRQTLLDAIRIARRVLYNRYKDITDETTDRFMRGEDTRQIARETKEELRARGYPELGEEEWEVIQDDLQTILLILVREPTYRQGIERIFTLLDRFQRRLQTDENLHKKVLPEEVHIKNVMTETEELVASFSGRETLEHFKYHLKRLIRLIQSNENLQDYLTELKTFVLKASSEEEIRSEEFRVQSKQLARRGRTMMREIKDDDDVQPFFDAADEMIENIKNDEFLQILRHQAGIVKSDISFVDPDGVVQVDTDMLGRLQSVLLPVLADALKYIPIPRIQSSDSKSEFWLDNIVICSYDIIPENVRFHLETDSDFSLRDMEHKSTNSHLVVQLDHLLTELKDVEFYYKKKSTPEFEEGPGRVTFREKGKGATLTLVYNVVQGPEDNAPRITEGYATFHISDMEINFDKSTLRHSVLVPMLTKVFKTFIKKQVEKKVEDNLSGFIKKLGVMLMKAMIKANKPFMSGIDAARRAIKNSAMAQVYEKRHERLE
jgi:hypothetical protein